MQLNNAVDEVIEENPLAVEDYHDGEPGAMNFLVGQVMHATGGSEDPGYVQERLEEELGETST